MKNVLIISYSFPPLNNIAAQRYGKMVKYFRNYGWQPWILTTQNNGTTPVEIEEKYIIRIGIHPKCNPENQHCKKSISKAIIPSALAIYRRIAGPINFRLSTIDRTVFQWYWLVKQNEEMIIKTIGDLDMVIASYGPPAAIWSGKHLANRFKVPWIIDVRDLGAMRINNQNKAAIGLDKLIERYAYRSVSGITAVSDTLSQLLLEAYNKPVETIYNGWDIPLDSSKSKHKDYLKKDNEINQKGTKDANEKVANYIYYAGCFYEHRIESIKLLISCLDDKLNKQVILKIRSLGPKELELKIKDYAYEINKLEKIQILPPCDQETVEMEQKNAMINVVFEDLDANNNWSKGTLTGKFLPLLKQQQPILSIARPDSDIGDILLETKKGKLCSTAEEITSFINEFIENSENYRGNHGTINEYSKKRQAERLCIFLDSLIKN